MEETKLRKFLQDAKIPEDDAEVYLSLFIQNNLEESHIANLKEEQLIEMGIKNIAHINSILNEAKKYETTSNDDIQRPKEEIQAPGERIQHVEERLQRLEENFQHNEEGIQHVREGIQHVREGMQHVREGIQHNEEIIQHVREAIHHNEEMIQHAREAMQHNRERIQYLGEAVQHLKENINIFTGVEKRSMMKMRKSRNSCKIPAGNSGGICSLM